MAYYEGNGNANTINGSNNADEIYGKGGKDWLYGNGGDDYIDGGIGADFIFGGDGNDILFGNKGNDTMDGGLGADEFRGGQGSDTVDYSSATSAVTAYLTIGTSGGYAAGDSYTQMENVNGSAYDDLLQAGAGGLAAGGAGADWLYGAAAAVFSNDDGGRLRGDAGFDNISMYFGATEMQLQNGQGYDTVHGFDEGTDKFFVKLSDFGLGNTLDAFELRNNNTGTAVGTNAQFIYEGDDDRLWFDSNGTNTGGRILVADMVSSTIDDGNLDLGDFAWAA